MRFDNTTIRILVRKNYGECFDFYTDKIGLTPVWGDRNGPYTSFAVEKDAPPCFAIFNGENMSCLLYTSPYPPVISLFKHTQSSVMLAVSNNCNNLLPILH